MMSGPGGAAGMMASTGGGRMGAHTQEMLHAWSMAGNRGTADGTTNQQQQQQQQVDRTGELAVRSHILGTTVSCP